MVSLLIGVGFGVARARLMHLWRDRGILVRQGNWTTVSLWIIGLGIHIASDAALEAVAPAAADLGTVSLLLYLAVMLGAQRWALLRRAARLLTARPGGAPTAGDRRPPSDG
ncbi:hypothetical protein BDK92_0890 [Micromonospora pisi]|uniref:Uncharacterized protein n=1 Tax=Micromonospora pisi TaxID=589240 RepID=A0A495JCK4_9ACTN|nr:hypothetical protein BDK92_0890 [Micromonospora pisi]